MIASESFLSIALAGAAVETGVCGAAARGVGAARARVPVAIHDDALRLARDGEAACRSKEGAVGGARDMLEPAASEEERLCRP